MSDLLSHTADFRPKLGISIVYICVYGKKRKKKSLYECSVTNLRSKIIPGVTHISVNHQ